MHRGKRTCLSSGDTVLKGKYEILKVIHTSGMANVYLVSDRNLNKQWCLKEIIKSEAGKNMIEYRSLLQEANIMKGLNHSGIPRIVTIEEDGDSIFIVMDYISGISIKSWIQRSGKIKQEIVVSWMKQLCSIMIYLHNRKDPIFYRDMKPDNIMIQQNDGNIKLLDFGISEVITENNKVIKDPLGTRGFAAPEQKKKGLPYDLRSDIFGMGRTMYYMLTGVNPSVFEPDKRTTVKLKSIRQIDPSLSVGLEKIVNKCIELNPDDRYQSVEELLYDLQIYDKLDVGYKNKIRRRVNTVAILFISSFLIMILSLIPFGMDKARKDKEYRNLIEVAYQSGKYDDYYNAIERKPTALEPYIGYIDAIKQDGVFSKQEESDILGFINPNLTTIKEDKQYGELAFNIGKLYWFYYESDSSDDGTVLSVKWFKDAIDNGFNQDESNVYYQLGSFKKDISMSIAESNDSGMYKEYWNNLMKAKDNNNGEIVELQLYNALADAISQYSYRLKTDGITREEIDSVIKEISNYLKESSPSEGKAQELYNTLNEVYQTLPDKVNVTFGGGDE